MLGEYKNGKLYIEGLEYVFPEKPNLKSVRNYGLPKFKQLWKRREEYMKFDWSDDYEERLSNPQTDEDYKQLKYLEDEVTRLYEGEWIFIGGELVYLNPYMYFFLQWFVLQDTGEYPEYRDTSLYYFRFLEIVDKEKLCTGHTLLKARRLGASSMIAARLLLRALTNRNKNLGIISKTGVDARNIFDFVVNAFQALPIFLKPMTEASDSPKQILAFRKPASRMTKEKKVASGREGLNSSIRWGNTKLNTFDGGAYLDILVDESGKFPTEVPIKKYLQIVTKCVKKGAMVTGKLSLPTTVNPPQLGGAEYREVWDNSDQLKRDYLGQTISGLYRIMIPAFYGFAGYIDQYGNSVWDKPTQEQTKYLKSTGECPDPNIGAKEYLENVRKALENDPEALQEEKRMNPFSAEEAFDAANNRCMFQPTAYVDAQISHLEQIMTERGMNKITGELGRRGWFDMLPNGDVVFRDDPSNGMWYVHYLLPPELANQYKFDDFGNRVPMNQAFGAAGLDPIQSTDATVDKGSDACCIIRRRYTFVDPENSGIPVAMFLGRMNDEDKMYDQVYNGLIYYGVKMLAERAPSSWSTFAKRPEKKYTKYLYSFQRSGGEPVYGIPAGQSKDTINEHLRVQQAAFLHDHDKIPFIRLARDRRDFDPDKRTEYDGCMADGYALMALEMPFKKADKPKGERVYLMEGRILQ